MWLSQIVLLHPVKCTYSDAFEGSLSCLTHYTKLTLIPHKSYCRQGGYYQKWLGVPKFTDITILMGVQYFGLIIVVKINNIQPTVISNYDIVTSANTVIRAMKTALIGGHNIIIKLSVQRSNAVTVTHNLDHQKKRLAF